MNPGHSDRHTNLFTLLPLLAPLLCIVNFSLILSGHHCFITIYLPVFSIGLVGLKLEHASEAPGEIFKNADSRHHHRLSKKFSEQGQETCILTTSLR